MNYDYEEMKKSFIDERIAILEYDSGLFYESNGILMAEAERCWELYRKQSRIYENEQEGLI